jgi:hypothetical protein
MDTKELFEHIIYNSQVNLIKQLVEKFNRVDENINEQFLVSKFLSHNVIIVDDKTTISTNTVVKKKRGRPRKKKMLVIE